MGIPASGVVRMGFINAVSLLRFEAEEAYRDLKDSLEGLTQPFVWSVVPLLPGEYLHGNGSILGIVQHLAGAR